MARLSLAVGVGDRHEEGGGEKRGRRPRTRGLREAQLGELEASLGVAILALEEAGYQGQRPGAGEIGQDCGVGRAGANCVN